MFIFKREQSIYGVTLTAFKDHNIWSYHASMFKNKNKILLHTAKKKQQSYQTAQTLKGQDSQVIDHIIGKWSRFPNSVGGLLWRSY
jgi:hypothetical protein